MVTIQDLQAEMDDLRQQIANSQHGWPAAAGFDFHTGAEGSEYGMRILHRTEALLTLASSTTRTALYTATIPQLAIGLNGWLRTTVSGTMLQNTGVSRTVTFDVEFGGGIVWQATSANIVTDTAERVWAINLEITNINDMAVNFLNGTLHYTSPANAATIGIGGISPTATNEAQSRFGAEMTVDVRNQPTLGVYATLSASSADFWMRRKYGRTEILP